MRVLINILLIILALFVIATVLFGLMMIASSHHIPADTINKISISLLVLGALIGILIYLKRKVGC